MPIVVHHGKPLGAALHPDLLQLNAQRLPVWPEPHQSEIMSALHRLGNMRQHPARMRWLSFTQFRINSINLHTDRLLR